MVIRTGIGNAPDCLDCGSEGETFRELPDDPFPDEPFPDALLDDLDIKLGTVVLLHLDLPSTTAGYRLLLCLSSDQVVFTEREAKDPSRELVKSRKDVTPSESPLEGLKGGSVTKVGGMDKGVNRNRILEVPCKNSGLVGIRTGGLVSSSRFGGSELPDAFPGGLP